MAALDRCIDMMVSLAGAEHALPEPQARSPMASAAPAPSTRGASEPDIAPTLALPPLTETERAWVAEPASIPSSARLGFGRAIPDDDLTAALSDPDHWRPIADGGLHLTFAIASPGARGLRLGLALGALPEGARLRVFSAHTADLEPIRGAEISERLARVRGAAADASVADAPLFWTPLVRGETLTLELQLPPGVKPDDLDLRPVRVSHLFRLPFAAAGERSAGGDDCELDLACADDPLLERLARASAILLYTLPDGGSNACSGVLLADGDPATRIPYLVTAHHCVPDQARASSVETYWSHQAEACGAVPVRVPERATGGADLLSARESIDTVLLRLRGEPPRAAVFVDWSATLPEIGTEVVSVHYPHGQTTKVGRGRVCAHRHCVDVDYCGADAEPDGLHYLGVTWTEGITSAGSSGAGTFRVDTGALVGVLTGGLSSCAAPMKSDDFGWFGWVFWEMEPFFWCE